MEEIVHDGIVIDNTFGKIFLYGNMGTNEIVHTNRSSLVCEFCEKVFTKKSHNDRHKRIHTGEKPFECDVCKKVFSRKGHLESHMKTHTGEKPYECSVCKKKISDQSHFKRHMRIHTGEKPYKCNICEKKFSQNNGLKNHIRIHTGEKSHECNICKRTFSVKDKLKRHMRTHTGENPYECSICKRKFPRRYNLETHMRSHTGEKPYECNICKRKFAQKCNLNVHMRVHSEKKPQLEDVVLSSESLEKVEDTHYLNDENVLYIKEEVSGGFDSDNCPDNGRESFDDSEGHFSKSNSVVGHNVLCESGDENSHLASQDIDRESGNDHSPKNGTQNVLQYRPEELCQMVETVIDENIDCQTKIENTDSPSEVCEGARKSSNSNVIMADRTPITSDDKEFDIYRVYVVESKNSGSCDTEDRNCNSSDDILVMPKKENDESLDTLDMEEEPNLL